MSDIPEALVEKAAMAVAEADYAAGRGILNRPDARFLARAILAAVWSDLPAARPVVDDREPKPCPRCGVLCTYDGWDHVHPNGVGIGSCIDPREGRGDATARPVVDRGALADEVAACIEESQSPLRDVPQADMAYERAAQDARDAIHASENIQDRPGVCADRDALVGLIRRSAMLRATTSEGEWATRLADTILARLVVQDAADVRRAVAAEIAAANVAPPEWMPNPIRSTGQEQYDAGYRAGIAALQAEIRRIIAGEVGERDG